MNLHASLAPVGAKLAPEIVTRALDVAATDEFGRQRLLGSVRLEFACCKWQAKTLSCSLLSEKPV